MSSGVVACSTTMLMPERMQQGIQKTGNVGQVRGPAYDWSCKSSAILDSRPHRAEVSLIPAIERTAATYRSCPALFAGTGLDCDIGPAFVFLCSEPCAASIPRSKLCGCR
ncbi:uncharacterized protein B0H18DRAFT_92609 [Fomitopsis serialis]|uniref:uncharacterized protein n=1 Tax=Fomitopsis serialis TaxID=139415 RepID=UPI002008A3ED|nr:uncharacterized protein B0H18DRAFT_92609 [Neoantrodia serialis]KAH9915651.1 hypothetical protein B0H18DRAFT_92609 [Neoantrodia serialis]